MKSLVSTLHNAGFKVVAEGLETENQVQKAMGIGVDRIQGFYYARPMCEKDLIEFLIPQYISEGKNQLVISIGCTGGKHRSVTIANEIYKKFLHNAQGYGIKVEHRDIERDRIAKK